MDKRNHTIMKKILFLLLSTLLLVSSGAQSEGIFSKSKFDFLKDEPQLMPVDQAFVFDAQQQGNLVKISIAARWKFSNPMARQ